jgi:hypothetical protein
MPKPPSALIADQAPTEGDLTEYDLKHFSTHLRPLEADSEGVDWAEAARTVLHLDPTGEPHRACVGHPLGAGEVAHRSRVSDLPQRGG